MNITANTAHEIVRNDWQETSEVLARRLSLPFNPKSSSIALPTLARCVIDGVANKNLTDENVFLNHLVKHSDYGISTFKVDHEYRDKKWVISCVCFKRSNTNLCNVGLKLWVSTDEYPDEPVAILRHGNQNLLRQLWEI